MSQHPDKAGEELAKMAEERALDLSGKLKGFEFGLVQHYDHLISEIDYKVESLIYDLNTYRENLFRHLEYLKQNSLEEFAQDERIKEIRRESEQVLAGVGCEGEQQDEIVAKLDELNETARQYLATEATTNRYRKYYFEPSAQLVNVDSIGRLRPLDSRFEDVRKTLTDLKSIGYRIADYEYQTPIDLIINKPAELKVYDFHVIDHNRFLVVYSVCQESDKETCASLFRIMSTKGDVLRENKFFFKNKTFILKLSCYKEKAVLLTKYVDHAKRKGRKYWCRSKLHLIDLKTLTVIRETSDYDAKIIPNFVTDHEIFCFSFTTPRIRVFDHRLRQIQAIGSCQSDPYKLSSNRLTVLGATRDLIIVNYSPNLELFCRETGRLVRKIFPNEINLEGLTNNGESIYAVSMSFIRHQEQILIARLNVRVFQILSLSGDVVFQLRLDQYYEKLHHVHITDHGFLVFRLQGSPNAIMFRHVPDRQDQETKLVA